MEVVTRKLAPLVALVVVFSMGLAGFAGTVSAAGAKHSTKAKSATHCAKRDKATGTLKYSDWQFPDTLNPFQTTEAVSYETINGLFDGLFVYNNKAKLVPQMATRVPSVKNGDIRNGGKQIVIHLKHGLHWSNGATVTSKDVKFGWQIGMDKVTGPFCSGSCDVITRIDTPNKYTAVLNLKQVFAPAIPAAIPPIWPTKWGSDWNNDAHAAAVKLEDPAYNFESSSFPTNGAYQVSEYVKDNRIVLHPMKYYTDMNCGAYVKNMIFAFYSSKPDLIAAAASKDTDITQNYTAADLGDLSKYKSYTIHADPGFIFEHLELNVDPQYNGSANPLANAKVRQALALSLDKVGLIRSALGVHRSQALSVAAWTPWVNTPKLVQPFADKKITGQWDPIAKKYVIPGTPSAIKDAKKLLSQTPYKNGFNLDFYTTAGNPTRAAQEAVTAASWKKIGVNVVPNFVPGSKLFGDWEHNGTTDRGTFQVAMFAFQGAPDPDGFKYELESKYIDREKQNHSSINENYSGVRNSTLDKAFSAAAKTFDNKVRTAQYSKIQTILNQQAYWITLYFRPSIATSDNHVVNFLNNPTSAGPTWNMYNYKTKS